MKKDTSGQLLPYSIKIRHETKKIHTMAERCTFMRGFLRGAATIESYLVYLRGLQQVYRTLEKLLTKHRDHHLVGYFFHPELFREPTIAEDLAFFGAETQSLPLKSAEAIDQYLARLEKLGREQPEGLIAHAYTRYMGDLSGGQILSGIAAKTLGLNPATGGLAFYHFADIPNIPQFKKVFRSNLDRIPDHGDALETFMTNEAIRAFQLNIQFFSALEGNALRAFCRQFWPKKPSPVAAKLSRATSVSS